MKRLLIGAIFAFLIGCGDAAQGGKEQGPPPPPTTGIGILSWSPNADADHVTSYHIYRSTVPGSNIKGVYFATVDGAITTFSDDVGLVGTTYYYVLTADNGLESDFSNEVSKTF